MTTFREWLNESKEEQFEELTLETINEDNEKVQGSLEKLIDVMKGKKDAESKNISKMAKGILKKLKKDGGISSDSAEWLFKTWTSFRA